MFEIIALAAAGAAGFGGYTQSRGFVRRRLRFIDGVQKAGAPIMAGCAATVAGSVLVAFIPFVGAGTAILFGLGVGFGVSHGARDIRYRRLPG